MQIQLSNKKKPFDTIQETVDFQLRNERNFRLAWMFWNAGSSRSWLEDINCRRTIIVHSNSVQLIWFHWVRKSKLWPTHCISKQPTTFNLILWDTIKTKFLIFLIHPIFFKNIMIAGKFLSKLNKIKKSNTFYSMIK